MRIDLHTHSSRSDGTTTPAELLAQARQHGLSVVALTDHDTSAGWAEAATAAGEHGLTLVRGMEVSTKHEGRSVHLLAYLPDPTYPPLAAELARINAGRGDRLPEMVRRLQEAGYEITVDDVRDAAEPGAVLGRPHVADALAAKGIVADRTEAFAGLIGPRGPGYVSRYGAPLVETIELVRGAGGVTVLAHPWGRSKGMTGEAIAMLAERGLTGLEVDHQDHDHDQRLALRKIAADLDLVVTGSSDFHGAGKVDHELGCNTTDPAEYARLVVAATRARQASGRPAPEVLEP